MAINYDNIKDEESLVKEAVALLKKKVFGKKFNLTVQSQNDIYNYALTKIDKRYEIVLVFYLNAKNKIVAETRHVGTIAQSLFYPREMARIAFETGALGIIVCHNHPSGDKNPSEVDIKTTEKLVKGFSFLDLQVLDHLVIGENGFYSFFQEGKIEIWRKEIQGISFK